jgi:ATP-dependent 26S proteasome regulatory subunit
MPVATERFEIWKTSVSSRATFANDVDVWAIARKYELSGSSIVSVMHYASLQAIHKDSFIISKADILEGIKREYEKEEKVFTSNE